MPWQKGQSGNPTGRRKQTAEQVRVQISDQARCLRILRARVGGISTEQALWDWALGPAQLPEIRLKAFLRLRDECYGKPLERVEHSGGTTQRYVLEVPAGETQSQWLARQVAAAASLEQSERVN